MTGELRGGEDGGWEKSRGETMEKLPPSLIPSVLSNIPGYKGDEKIRSIASSHFTFNVLRGRVLDIIFLYEIIIIFLEQVVRNMTKEPI